MNLSDLMHRDVQVIQGDTSLREAARRMSEHCIGVLPVCVGDRIQGMLTDRDIVVRSVARGDDPDKTRAVDAMTRQVEWCYEDQSVDDASKKMCDRQIQRLLVMNRDKRLVGIVTLADLTRARGQAPAVTHMLEDIKAPTRASAAGVEAQHIGH